MSDPPLKNCMVINHMLIIKHDALLHCLTRCRCLHPSILWAQRKDTLLLTVSLNDIQDETFSLEETTFQFSGVGGSDRKQYSVQLEFYKDVIPQVHIK